MVLSRPDDLSSIAKTHMVESEKLSSACFGGHTAHIHPTLGGG